MNKIMATGDPMWKCKYCGGVYYTANEYTCGCPNSLKELQNRLLEDEFDKFFAVDKPKTLPKKGTSSSLNDVYDEVLGPDVFKPKSKETTKQLLGLQQEEEDDTGDFDINELLDSIKEDSIVEDIQKRFNKTLVVNLFAGPGSGKSTTAAGVFSELKCQDINCELVPEYAKDLVWEDRQKTFEDQLYMFGKQYHRIFRLLGQVDVIITDSPILLSVVYDTEKRQTLRDLVIFENSRMWRCNFFLQRKKKYNPKGRNHDEREAKELDRRIYNLLNEVGESYQVFEGTPGGKNQIVQEVLHAIKYRKTVK